MKKLFGILASMLAAVLLLPGAVSAAGNEAKIGDTEYITLIAAVNAAEDGDTITLIKDVALAPFPVTIKKSLTIDLGGFTVSRSNYSFDVYNELTLKNGTVQLNYSTAAESRAAIWLREDAKLTVAEDVTVQAIENNEPGWAIGLYSDVDGATLIFNGTIKGEGGITVNGRVTTNNTIQINNGAKIETEGSAFYQAGNATTTIGAATLASGTTAVEVRAGTLTLDGATLTTTGQFSEKPNGNGLTTTGVALAVSQHTTNQPINVTVNSGSLTGEKAFYEADLQDDEASSEFVTLSLAGGNYKGAVASANHTEFVSGGIFNQPVEATYVVPASTVANRTSGNTTTYFIGTPTTVAANLADTKAGDTIEVTQGDLELAALPSDVTVKNTGEGTVTANGETATAEGVTTVAPAEPETDPISPPTGDAFNPVVWAIVTGLAAILFGATLYQSRKQRR